jgi:hypothetical protein
VFIVPLEVVYADVERQDPRTLSWTLRGFLSWLRYRILISVRAPRSPSPVRMCTRRLDV